MLSPGENARVRRNEDRQVADSFTGHELLTVAEVAALLTVPVSWVYERTRRRGTERMPHFKLGKYLRFSEREVLEWVDRTGRN